jgi:hypothetical protein
MKLRVIESDLIGVWELGKYTEIKEPTLVHYKARGREGANAPHYTNPNGERKIVVSVIGRDPLAEMFIMDQVPENVMFIRSARGVNLPSRGIFHSQGDLQIDLLVPKRMKVQEVVKVFSQTVADTCVDHGIEAFISGNDVKFRTGDLKKKFSGTTVVETKTAMVVSTMVTFNIDVDLMNQVYDFTHKKFQKEEPIDLNSTVGGLNEISDITPETFMGTFIPKLAEGLKLEYYIDSLLPGERKTIEYRQTILNTRDWIVNGNYPGDYV